jgi:adenylate cyclase
MSASSKAVFLSYASQDAAAAHRIRDQLRRAGLEIWFDQNELRGGDAWDAAIRRQIRECALFIPLISSNTDARGEGYFRLEWKLAVERSHLMADDQPFLMPLVIDDTREDLARVPDRFRERQWMRLHDGAVPAEHITQLLRLCVQDAAMAAEPPETAASNAAARSAPPGNAPRDTGTRTPAAAPATSSVRLGVCVLPFANMSGEAEQEYFSDGITEDIITDLSKVSALWVAARNTAFTFKGKPVDVLQVARQLKASHVLEGSVRKAGGRVRITAQLIDGTTGGHVWAERYDRKLDDIFALQDEISQAIVAALKLKLLPEEKAAIEKRGTTNPEAYKLYLMARQYHVANNIGAARSSEAIVRLCQRATQIDPRYARAWALMAVTQAMMAIMLSREGDGGLEAAERALALDPGLAEAHAAKAFVLTLQGQLAAAQSELDRALELDPESYDVNLVGGRLYLALRDFPRAIALYGTAAAAAESDYYAAGMLIGCYQAMGDNAGARQAASRALRRCENAVAIEPDNGSAMSFLVVSLAYRGEVERMHEWMERAMLLDPDNLNMRYNFACTYINVLHDHAPGLELLEYVLEKCRPEVVIWMRSDPDLDEVRELPRFKVLVAKAEARIAQRG